MSNRPLRFASVLAWIKEFGADLQDTETIRFQKGILTVVMMTTMLALVPWMVIDFYYDEWLAGVLNSISFVVIAVNLILLYRTHNFHVVLNCQIAAAMLISFAMTLMLGGIGSSGVFILWGFLGVVGSVVFDSLPRARFWLITFVGLVALAALLQPILEPASNLPQAITTLAVITNIGLAAVFVFFTLRYYIDQLDRTLGLLRQEQERSERLLLNVLPKMIADRLRKEERTIADQCDEISVLFADVVGFTPLSERLPPRQALTVLNDIFSHFDDLAVKYGVEKIRTIGDGYMAAAGVPIPLDSHAHALANMALAMVAYMQSRPSDAVPLQLRIGINSGPAVAGIVGVTKFHYDVWGDAVNVAARMESQGEPGKIQIGEATHALIKDDFVCKARGWIEVKGKGQMQTWFLEGAIAEPATAVAPSSLLPMNEEPA